jgi:hypothetical protein
MHSRYRAVSLWGVLLSMYQGSASIMSRCRKTRNVRVMKTKRRPILFRDEAPTNHSLDVNVSLRRLRCRRFP